MTNETEYHHEYCCECGCELGERTSRSHAHLCDGCFESDNCDQFERLEKAAEFIEFAKTFSDRELYQFAKCFMWDCHNPRLFAQTINDELTKLESNQKGAA